VDKDGNIRCRKDDFGNPILYYDGWRKKRSRDIQQDIAKLLKNKMEVILLKKYVVNNSCFCSDPGCGCSFLWSN
jgi:hypothetical protein